jgi:hypothetical protein
MLTAATTRFPDHTGADTLATPDSRSPTLSAQPRLRQHLIREAGIGAGPRRQDLRSGARGHGEQGPFRNGVPQPGGRLHAGHAEPLSALPAVHLGALAGLVAQAPQSGQRDGAQPVAARRRRQLGDAGPDRVPALLVLGQQPQIHQR